MTLPPPKDPGTLNSMTDHDLLIRLDANMEAVRHWVDNHDCDHTAFQKELKALREQQLRWAGGMAFGMMVLTLGANVLSRMFMP